MARWKPIHPGLAGALQNPCGITAFPPPLHRDFCFTEIRSFSRSSHLKSFMTFSSTSSPASPGCLFARHNMEKGCLLFQEEPCRLVLTHAQAQIAWPTPSQVLWSCHGWLTGVTQSSSAPAMPKPGSLYARVLQYHHSGCIQPLLLSVACISQADTFCRILDTALYPVMFLS